jgi:hypothetical protein
MNADDSNYEASMRGADNGHPSASGGNLQPDEETEVRDDNDRAFRIDGPIVAVSRYKRNRVVYSDTDE